MALIHLLPQQGYYLKEQSRARSLPQPFVGCSEESSSWTPVFCTHPAGPKSKQKQKGTMPPIYQHRNGLNTTCHVFLYSRGRAQITPSFPKATGLDCLTYVPHDTVDY